MLKDKVTVITGAGRGIGRALALGFAREGARVVVNDYGVTVDGHEPSSQPADVVVGEIKQEGGTAVANYDTVATMRGAENIIKTAVDSFGRIDVLVNNAGILRPHMVWNMTEEDWDGVMAVHLKGTFACTKFAALQMKEQQHGCILCVTSSVGLVGTPSLSNYSAAKAGIVGFARTVAKELARFHINVNAYHIGARTRMTENPERLRQLRQGQAQAAPSLERREAMLEEENRPEAGVPLVVYLASDEASDITGHVFYMGRDTMAVWNLNTWVKSAVMPGGWTVEQARKAFRATIGAGLPDAIAHRSLGG